MREPRGPSELRAELETDPIAGAFFAGLRVEQRTAHARWGANSASPLTRARRAAVVLRDLLAHREALRREQERRRLRDNITDALD